MVNGSGSVKFAEPDHELTRTQDLEDFFHDSGQFYWGKVEAFIKQRPIFSKSATPYILPRYLVQDVDTPEDWKRAELMYQMLKKSGEFD